jgi:hypothetical protein
VSRQPGRAEAWFERSLLRRILGQTSKGPADRSNQALQGYNADPAPAADGLEELGFAVHERGLPICQVDDEVERVAAAFVQLVPDLQEDDCRVSRGQSVVQLSCDGQRHDLRFGQAGTGFLGLVQNAAFRPIPPFTGRKTCNFASERLAENGNVRLARQDFLQNCMRL